MDRRELLNDEQEALRMAMDGRLSSLWVALPGIVKKVNLSKRTCEVQPAIQGRVQSSNGQVTNVNLPLLVDCPIVFPGGGGFTLTFPLKANDEVLVVFASRCIDSWWQSGGVGVQMEFRMHDLSDGFAIAGIKSQPNVEAAISSSATQLRSEDGSVFIEVGTSLVKVKAPAAEVDAAETTIKGNLIVTGNVTCVNMTASTGATIGGKNFSSHAHSGVQPGTGQTGGVV